MFQDVKTPDTVVDDEVMNDGFFPNVSIADFQRECRIPPEYNPSQQRNMIISAIAGINIELVSFRQRSMSQGYQQMADIGPRIGGQSAHVSSYLQAVHHRAKASLLVHFATLERRKEAESLGKEGRETHTSLMALSQMAVRNILGMTVASVKLL
ncbi:head completion/stabilization protein [Shewanella sp. WE21]|uniref:head completion/stabilization protein n=1 Tax=Shewanella sp. WE21 TaxID=2029986 RepID=UPI001319D7E6|nr:head completion/stabilization protein [Shewanella sp. WE21]